MNFIKRVSSVTFGRDFGYFNEGTTAVLEDFGCAGTRAPFTKKKML